LSPGPLLGNLSAEGGVLLTIAYDGAGFAGFAPQREARTVAGELLDALRVLDAGIEELRGASRTDAGVHARGQRVAFDPTVERPLSAWVLGVVRHLPDSITVRRAARIPRGFLPRFASVSKHYRYLVLTDGVRDPFTIGRAWRIPELRDDAALQLARAEAAAALGTHDFRAFRTAHDQRKMTERTLTQVEVSRFGEDPRIVRVDVRGKAFMHNMVRILVGTMVDVARGRLAPGAMTRAIASGDRRAAGTTAPAHGLYLEDMELDVVESEAFVP
jgi:tRNA pseudouridine38-40 synthase